MPYESLSFKIECQGSPLITGVDNKNIVSHEANEFWQNIPVPEDLLENQEEPEAE